MPTPSDLVIVLVQPQLGENIGMVCRAMLNCGLTRLRLVAPRDGWPSEQARKSASGADAVIDATEVFETTEDAIRDLDTVLATTARPRDMTKPVYTPETAAATLRGRAQAGRGVGVLFGREAHGLDNEDVALADAVITVPLNPVFTSLNLAQAVLLVAYEWFKAGDATPGLALKMPTDTRPANKDEMLRLLGHLEEELDARGFFRVDEKKPSMVRNIRNLLWRAEMTEKETRMMHGMISALAKFPRKDG